MAERKPLGRKRTQGAQSVLNLTAAFGADGLFTAIGPYYYGDRVQGHELTKSRNPFTEDM